MAGLWRYREGKGKYLVLRRDGSIPQWPWFVIAAADPAAPVCIRAYADEAERQGFDPDYVSDLRAMANEFDAYRKANGQGDPDAPRHRTDCELVARLLDQMPWAG